MEGRRTELYCRRGKPYLQSEQDVVTLIRFKRKLPCKWADRGAILRRPAPGAALQDGSPPECEYCRRAEDTCAGKAHRKRNGSAAGDAQTPIPGCLAPRRPCWQSNCGRWTGKPHRMCLRSACGCGNGFKRAFLTGDTVLYAVQPASTCFIFSCALRRRSMRTTPVRWMSKPILFRRVCIPLNCGAIPISVSA